MNKQGGFIHRPGLTILGICSSRGLWPLATVVWQLVSVLSVDFQSFLVGGLIVVPNQTLPDSWKHRQLLSWRHYLATVALLIYIHIMPDLELSYAHLWCCGLGCGGFAILLERVGDEDDCSLWFKYWCWWNVCRMLDADPNHQGETGKSPYSRTRSWTGKVMVYQTAHQASWAD